jgi:hypothetical protein
LEVTLALAATWLAGATTLGAAFAVISTDKRR